MSRDLRARLAIVLLAVLVSLGVAEIGLRVIGRGPCQPFEALADVPVMTAPHATLGWTNQPGTYRYSPTGSDADTITVTLASGGARLNRSSGQRHIAAYGGSFTFGFGVTDGSDFPAQLGEALPGARIRNAAVPGYGTVQSRALSLQHLHDNIVPDTIIYGLVDYHDARNAGTRAWLHALSRAGGHHPWQGVPWAHWNGEELTYYPPRAYQHWNASEWCALANLTELVSIDLRDRLHRTKTETTVQTVLDWRRQATEAGVQRFVVALLYAPSRHRAYLRRLSEEGVEVIDLRGSGFPEASVPLDGHPDATVHAAWARGLAEALR